MPRKTEICVVIEYYVYNLESCFSLDENSLYIYREPPDIAEFRPKNRIGSFTFIAKTKKAMQTKKKEYVDVNSD